VRTLQLARLPKDTRTFKSRTENALVAGEVTAIGSRIDLALPPRSITALVADGETNANRVRAHRARRATTIPRA